MSILVVDDSPDSLLMLESTLKAEGYTDLVAVASAQSAFEYLKMDDTTGVETDVDLILMDIMMPEIDGIEACRQIKATPHLQYIPIVMVTVSTKREDLEAALGAGAVDYVTKPVNKTELLNRMCSALIVKHEVDRLKTAASKLREEYRELGIE